MLLALLASIYTTVAFDDSLAGAMALQLGVGCGSGAWKACSKAALVSVVSCLLRRRMRQRGQGKLVGVVSAAAPNAAAAAEKRL